MTDQSDHLLLAEKETVFVGSVRSQRLKIIESFHKEGNTFLPDHGVPNLVCFTDGQLNSIMELNGTHGETDNDCNCCKHFLGI